MNKPTTWTSFILLILLLLAAASNGQLLMERQRAQFILDKKVKSEMVTYQSLVKQDSMVARNGQWFKQDTLADDRDDYYTEFDEKGRMLKYESYITNKVEQDVRYEGNKIIEDVYEPQNNMVNTTIKTYNDLNLLLKEEILRDSDLLITNEYTYEHDTLLQEKIYTVYMEDSSKYIKKTRYEYDGQNRAVRTVDMDSTGRVLSKDKIPPVVPAYEITKKDKDGRVLEEVALVKGKKRKHSYKYNAAGKVIEETAPLEANGDYSDRLTKTVKYTYDEASNLAYAEETGEHAFWTSHFIRRYIYTFYGQEAKKD